MIHKYNSLFCLIFVSWNLFTKLKTRWRPGHSGQRDEGPPRRKPDPGWLLLEAQREGPSLEEPPPTWQIPLRSALPHPGPGKPCCGECQSADILPPALSERGSAFSKPVGSMHHKQQRTAGLRYRLSPCDKCASSVVQRFSDTLPWAIILLLLLPSPSHTEHQALKCPSPSSCNNPSRPVMLKIEPWFRGAVGSPCEHPNVLNSHAR